MCNGLLSVASEISAILTAVVAGGAAIYLLLRKRQHKKALETYLRHVREKSDSTSQEKGARTTFHLMASLSMSENQLFDAAFGNPRIQVLTQVGEDGKSIGVLFRWKLGEDTQTEK